MPTPTYTLVINEIVLKCDSEESVACAELISLKDRNGTFHSDWWGHPTVRSRPDGTTTISLPSNVHNLALIHKCGATPDKTDLKTKQRLAFFISSKKDFKTHFPLMPFQNTGAERIVKGDLRRILAFPMGLGKTITAMAAIMSEQDRYLPAVIIAPAHVKLNWASEWEKWGGDPNDVVVLFGVKPNPNELAGKKLIVLNHHILKGWHKAIAAVNPKTMIIDEAHNFVNSKSKTYPLADSLARACGRRVLLLTATPLVNHLGDLWGLTTLISGDILGTKQVFADTFMPEEKAKARMFASRWSGGFTKTGWREVGMAKLPKAVMDKRIEQLGSILREHVIIHVKKEDVLSQLPNITETNLRIDIPDTTADGRKFWEVEEECTLAISEAKDDVLASDKMLPAFSNARRNSAFAKIPHAIAWIEDFLEESDETEKLVVVGWSVEPLEILHKHFSKSSVLINGSIDARKKKERGDQFFNDPKKRLLFGNVKSIGTGIDNLVAARSMLFIELPLTSVDFEQVKGRIDRLSQTSKALSYYIMTIRDSLEEKMILKIIKTKAKITKALGF